MDNYYTPDISELTMGLEYEEWSQLFGSPFFWNKCKIDDSMSFNNAWDIFNEGKTTNIRVKYLDKKEIMELGWTISDKKVPFMETIFQIDKSEKDCMDYYHLNVYRLLISLTKEGASRGHFTIEHEIAGGFIGTHESNKMQFRIKSKLELKKLMKQLNII